MTLSTLVGGCTVSRRAPAFDMCGVVGLVRRQATRDQLADHVNRMAATLAHRGPDGHGCYTDPDAPVALGFRRLAIIDLSPTGDQPMASRSGRWVIVFNGEVYNHLLLRSELANAGVTFRGRSDTETLVEAVDAWGFETALQRTNGMFAIAAWDTTARRLWLARDRLGEKPLYWMQSTNGLAFASELRALRTLSEPSLSIDPAAATALLRWSYIPHPHTIYDQVRQLVPGGVLEVDLADPEMVVSERSWWSLDDTVERSVRERRGTTIDDAVAELKPLLADAVATRLESDVPLGAFLSGGIDSSLVAAFGQQATAGQLRTFTVRMPDIGFDESVAAENVARALGTRHETIDLSLAEALTSVTKLAKIWDEPYADPSMLPTALLCSAARRHVTVCVGGDGGDELFGGYNRHTFGDRISRWSAHVPARLRPAISRALLLPSSHRLDALGRVTSSLLPTSARVPDLAGKLRKTSSLVGNSRSAWETLTEVWPVDALGADPRGPAVPTPSCNLSGVELMMFADTATVLPDQMMVKVDRASMHSSLEVRTPFLDHRLLEWSWRQPPELKISGASGKVILRKLASQMLPAATASRPKMGFDPPLGGWLRHELKPWADALLTRPRAVDEGWLDGVALRQVWDEHLSGKRNWEHRLWAVLMLESWLAEHHPR